MSPADLLPALRAVEERIRDAVVAACEQQSAEDLATVAGEDADGDTIYAIDVLSEELLVAGLAELADACGGILLIAEGLADGRCTLPAGRAERDCAMVVIVDPIDGTRGLMYQKRPAWILAGVARNRAGVGLADIEAAVMTEIPLVKQHRSDVLWAVRGAGAQAERWDRIARTAEPLALHPTRATDLAHGFATVARFFPRSTTRSSAIAWARSSPARRSASKTNTSAPAASSPNSCSATTASSPTCDRWRKPCSPVAASASGSAATPTTSAPN